MNQAVRPHEKHYMVLNKIVRLIWVSIQVDLTRRLGNMHGGVDDIKKHPYYAKINWDALYSQTAVSPYIPKVGTATIFILWRMIMS